MADHLTEEEQVEALKHWWKENGTSIIATVVLVLAAYSGWQYWQTKQKADSTAASVVYQDLLEAMDGGSERGDEKTTTAKHLAGLLKDGYGGFYGQSGHLFLAKLAVEAGDLKLAETELRAALSAGPSASFKPVINLRLASVLNAQGSQQQALTVLTAENSSGFEALFAEMRGDIYVDMAELNQARAAYQLALESEPEFSQLKQIQQKLDDLTISAEATVSATENNE